MGYRRWRDKGPLLSSSLRSSSRVQANAFAGIGVDYAPGWKYSTLSVPSSIYEVDAVGIWVVHLEGAIVTPSSLNRSLGHKRGDNAKRAGGRRGREKERGWRGEEEEALICAFTCETDEKEGDSGNGFMNS